MQAIKLYDALDSKFLINEFVLPSMYARPSVCVSMLDESLLRSTTHDKRWAHMIAEPELIELNILFDVQEKTEKGEFTAFSGMSKQEPSMRKEIQSTSDESSEIQIKASVQQPKLKYKRLKPNNFAKSLQDGYKRQKICPSGTDFFSKKQQMFFEHKGMNVHLNAFKCQFIGHQYWFGAALLLDGTKKTQLLLGLLDFTDEKLFTFGYEIKFQREVQYIASYDTKVGCISDGSHKFFKKHSFTHSSNQYFTLYVQNNQERNITQISLRQAIENFFKTPKHAQEVSIKQGISKKHLDKDYASCYVSSNFIIEDNSAHFYAEIQDKYKNQSSVVDPFRALGIYVDDNISQQLKLVFSNTCRKGQFLQNLPFVVFINSKTPTEIGLSYGNMQMKGICLMCGKMWSNTNIVSHCYCQIKNI